MVSEHAAYASFLGAGKNPYTNRSDRPTILLRYIGANTWVHARNFKAAAEQNCH